MEFVRSLTNYSADLGFKRIWYKFECESKVLDRTIAKKWENKKTDV